MFMHIFMHEVLLKVRHVYIFDPYFMALFKILGECYQRKTRNMISLDIGCQALKLHKNAHYFQRFNSQ